MKVDDPVIKYLKLIVPVVEGAYDSTLKIIDHIESVGEAGDISLDSFWEFSKNYAQLLVLLDKLVSDNEHLRAEIASHVILTKLTNAITLIKNVKALQEVDPAMIAEVLENVRTSGIMQNSLKLITPEALQLLRDALDEFDNSQEADQA